MDVPLSWWVGPDRGFIASATIRIPITNSPTFSSIDLKASARIEAPINLPKPPSLLIGPLTKDTATTQNEWIFPKGNHPKAWKPDSVKVFPESIGAVSFTLRDDNTYILRLDSQDPGFIGTIPFRVHIQFSSAKNAYKESINGIMKIKGKQKAIPSSLFFGTANAGTNKTASLRLLGKGTVTSAQTSNDRLFTTEITSEHNVRVSFTPSGKSRNCSGWVDIHYEKGTVLRVQIVAAVGKAENTKD